MTPSEDELYNRFREIEPVPFTRALEDRIIRAAESAPSGGTGMVRRRRALQSWVPASAGAVAAAILAAGAWYYGGSAFTGPSSGKRTSASHNQSLTITGEPVSPSNAVGLLDAPVSVRLWTNSVGTVTHRPTVYATLTNVGTGVIHAGTMFGVLSLHRSNTVTSNLGSSQWVGFVNAPRGDIQPGDSVNWQFQPIGATIEAGGQLKDKPSLRFFQAGFASPAKADAVWQALPVAINQVSVQQRRQWSTGQSIGVSARVTNLTSASIDLSRALAVIWFAPDEGTDWTQPDVVRFLDRLTPEVTAQMTLKAGQSEQCLFRLIGARTTDFLGMVPRVSFIVTR